MRYSGILAKKIPWAGPRGATLLTATEADARTDAELDKRMAALFRHYGLEPGDAWNLAIELAFAHVPGFKFEDPPKRTGRPLGKVAAGTPSYRKVFRDVEALRRANPKLTVKAACEQLKRTQRKTYAGQSVEAIRGRHRAWSKLIGLTRADIDAETKKSLRIRAW